MAKRKVSTACEEHMSNAKIIKFNSTPWKMMMKEIRKKWIISFLSTPINRRADWYSREKSGVKKFEDWLLRGAEVVSRKFLDRKKLPDAIREKFVNFSQTASTHMSTQYEHFCRQQARLVDLVETRVFEDFDVKIQFAKKMGEGPRLKWFPSLLLPNALMLVHNTNIVEYKVLGKGGYGKVSTCFIQNTSGFDPTVLYCVKEYFAKKKDDAVNNRDHEVLATKIMHWGVIRALGFSIDLPPRALFPYWNGGNLHCMLQNLARDDGVLSDEERKHVRIFQLNSHLHKLSKQQSVLTPSSGMLEEIAKDILRLS
ncbi:hypothetical protein R1sor_010732 [Riccia sorocarpa]|uniref:Protein kinase domain-containing protein n=1 Tax=Riccia sorocarpa TaxID=122646 RepID=A0ABD3I2Y2_9MARC